MVFEADLTGRRVAVALSGGVDSALAASLLKEQGAEVFGLTMVLHASSSPADAQRIAAYLDIPLHIVDLTERFEKCVITDFVDSYLQGQTPNPCVLCNARIKFGDLAQAAKARGAQAMATGHYARRIAGRQRVELHQGADPLRDQSYFLFALTPDQLDFARFPLGSMTKKEVRELAKNRGIPSAYIKDSQDICFVPGGDYMEILKRLRPGASTQGSIVDMQGRVLGTHNGIAHFTIGQRKGLGIDDRGGDNNEPLYVVKLDPAKAEVVVGPRECLGTKKVFLNRVNWLADDVPDQGLPVTTRLRSTQQPVPARFFADKEQSDEQGSEKGIKRGRILLDEPMFGVSSGQAGVVYHESRVLGGGWISGES